jgi:putative transposase
MSSRMKATLICDALRMAIWLCRSPLGLIVHSDRGSQYASKVYRNLLKAYGFIGSMSRLGNCWDNAVAESFFGSLKQERCQWRGITKPAMKHSRILCSILLYFITAKDC